MDSKVKSQRKVLAAKPKSQPKLRAEKRVLHRKNGKTPDKLQMPDLVAGREVLGRKLSVIKTTKKEAIWVKGAVKDFDEPTIRHKIKYDLPLPEVLKDSEEWLCLSKSGFMWKDDDFKCPFANPTYSLKHTPKREDAIGERVKVFWSAMSKWYQGKVVDYDAATGKHRVSFRDGEQNQYDLQQEALVWLDIPELSSEAALKRMRCEEGDPIAIIRNDENQAPVEREIKAAGTQRGAAPALKAPVTKKKQPKGAQEAVKEVPKAKQAEKQSKADPKTRAAKASAAAPAKGCKSSPGLTESNRSGVLGVNKKPLDDNKSSVSTLTPAPIGLAGAKTPKLEPATQQKVSAVPNGKGLVKGTPQAPVKSAAEEVSRKRSRLGDPALTSSGSAPPDAKRRAVLKTASVPVKARKLKAGGEESRLGVKRQKKEADLKFEECCQCVLGARVGVWWEDDHCYYKGKVVAHDWYRKKLKIWYDDGVEEYITPQKEDTRFMWLTPRALTAGASDAVHAAFQTLGASNAGLPVAPPQLEENKDKQQISATGASPQSDDQAASLNLADGSHLAALVPKQGSEGAKNDSQQRSAAQTDSVSLGAQPVDSTTKGMCMDSHTPSLLASALSGAHHLNLSPSTAGLFLGLHSMLGSHSSRGVSLAQPLNGLARGLTAPLHKLAPQPPAPQQPAAQQSVPTAAPHKGATRPGSAASRSGSVSNVSSNPQLAAPLVQGPAAEGWKISITFRGDKQQYHGRVLAYKADTSRHLVLWEDGEDEWVDISQELLTWHSEKGKSNGFSTGLPEGHDTPEGDKLIGWSLAVFWKHECKFFDGVVVDYDADLDQHTIHYSDGEERCESVHSLVFKYVLPPNVQPVGARRIHPPKRWQDSGSEPEEGTSGYRRQRRRLRGSSQEDDTDEEWMGGKPATERRTARQLSIAAPIRHSSSGHQRQLSLLQHGSLPSVRTPGSSEIRRLSSKCGSLLFFEGEDNPAISPATSPKTSPQISPPAKQEICCEETRSPSAVDRRVTCLKSAMGFKTGVKRVRLYLKGWTVKEQAEPTSSNQEGMDGSQDQPRSVPASIPAVKQEPMLTAEAMPDKHSLQLMLERVEAASLSMQTGTPVSMPSPPAVSGRSDAEKSGSASLSKQTSLPSTTILSAKATGGVSVDTAAETKTLDAPVGRCHSLTLSQDQRITPPPSPFANCFQPQQEASTDAGESRSNVHFGLPEPFTGGLTGSSVCSLLSKLRALSGAGLSGEVLASPTQSPDTPSAMGESQLLALSRTSSIVSDPLLAELLHYRLLTCKGQATLEEQLGLFQHK